MIFAVDAIDREDSDEVGGDDPAGYIFSPLGMMGSVQGIDGFGNFYDRRMVSPRDGRQSWSVPYGDALDSIGLKAYMDLLTVVRRSKSIRRR